LIQVVSAGVEIFFPAMISNVPYQLALGTLTIVFLAWGAFGFVEHLFRWRALATALAAQRAAIFALALTRCLLFTA
jgi:hypothetical protein